MNLKAYLERRARIGRDRMGGKVLWKRVETLEDAGRLVAMWLRQDLLYLPWDGTPIPYPETLKAEGFAEAMAQVNDLGIVTLCSQPGITRQREFVELLVDDAHFPLVQEMARAVGVEMEMIPDRPFRFRDGTPMTLALTGKPFTRLSGRRKDVASVLGYGSRSLKSSVARGQYTPLTLYDERFGRRGRVQEVLVRIALHLQPQRGADCDARPNRPISQWGAGDLW